MKTIFHYDSRVFQFLNKVTDLILLNILTILCSIPIFTIGAATTALYYTIDKMRQNEPSIFRTYLQAFKENFVQSTVIWLIMLVTGLILVLCIFICYSTNNTVFLILASIAMLIWCVIVSWLFPLMAKFTFATRNAIRNAILCSLAYWPVSLCMAIANIFPYLLLVFFPSVFFAGCIVWLALWFSLIAFCNLRLLQKPYALLIFEKSLNH